MRPRSSPLALALLLAWSGLAPAQTGVQVRPSGGELGLQLGGNWAGRTQAPANRRFDYWEWARFGIKGLVLDHRLLEFNAQLRPMWRQVSWTGPVEPGDLGARHFDFDVGGTLLGKRPYWASFRAARSTNTLRGRAGSEINYVHKLLEGRFGLRNRYLPVELSYRSTAKDQNWIGGPELPPESTDENRLRLTARNRKTSLLLERIGAQDRAAQLRANTSRGVFTHMLGWGKGSRLSTTLNYFEQSGLRSVERFSWLERVRLQHTRRVASTYGFSIARGKTAGGTTVNRTGEGYLSYRIGSRMSAVTGVRSRSLRHSGGAESALQISSAMNFAVQLPLTATLSAGASVAFERIARTPPEDGWILVVQEEHVVGPSSRFFLDNAFADPASVAVRSADGALVYEGGVDYQVLETPPFVEIVVLPAGRIEPGDTLSADYRYRLAPATGRSVGWGSYRVALAVRGLEVYHAAHLFRPIDVADESLLAEGGVLGAGGVGTRDELAIGVSFRGSVPMGTVDLRAETSRREHETVFSSTSSRVGGGITTRLLSTVSSSLGGNFNRTTTNDVRFDMWSLSWSIAWPALRSLWLRGSVSAWDWSQDVATDGRRLRQAFVGGGLDAVWSVGLTRVELRLSRSQLAGDVARTDDRLWIRAVRTF